MNTADAVVALEHLIDHLKDKGVSSFKGDCLAPDGTKLWSLELKFDRPASTRTTTTLDPLG